MAAGRLERAFGTKEEAKIPDRSPDVRGSYDDRLNRILQAATGVVAQVGYERASMRAVTRAAGVSLAGLYHYVDSKEDMLFRIQFRTFSALLNTLRERLHGLTEPAEQLRMMVRSHIEVFAANLPALKVCSHELNSLSGEAYEEVRRLRREYYDLTHAIVDRVFDTYAPDSALDRHVATMSLFGMLNWLYRWYDPTRYRSPSWLAGQLAMAFLGSALGANASLNLRGANSRTGRSVQSRKPKRGASGSCGSAAG